MWLMLWILWLVLNPPDWIVWNEPSPAFAVEEGVTIGPAIPVDFAIHTMIGIASPNRDLLVKEAEKNWQKIQKVPFIKVKLIAEEDGVECTLEIISPKDTPKHSMKAPNYCCGDKVKECYFIKYEDEK